MTLLHDLTAGQPQQPADRLAAVHGKARGIRRRRRVATSAALAVLAAAPLSLLVVDRQPDPVGFAGTPVTSWPDRSEGDQTGLGAEALAALTAQEAKPEQGLSGEPEGVRWLYRGTVTVEDEPFAVAALTATVDGRALVAIGEAAADDRDPDTGRLPWRFTTAPSAGARSVSTYLTYVRESARTVVVALGDPASRSVGWRQDPLPGASLAGRLLGGTATSDDGVFVVEVGGAVGRVELAGSEPVLGVPTLVAPAPPETPDGFASAAGLSGQVRQALGPDGPWIGDRTSGLPTEGDGALQDLYGRCYGGGTLETVLEDFDVLSETESRRTELGRGSLPCDGETHLVVEDRVLTGQNPLWSVTGDRLQAYALTIGS